MHHITELPPWERLLKKIAWAQLGDLRGIRILDFGSGQGITANYYACNNEVIAIEPSIAMIQDRWNDHPFRQIMGDVTCLSEMADGCFDAVICHNVLEYVDNKEQIVHELCRVLKSGGTMSIIKHNRAGRVMQMAVLLDDMEKAHKLLDGENSTAAKFGAIRYYEDEELLRWVPELCVNRCLGIRTFWDLQQNQASHGDEQWKERMLELEMRVSDMEAYRNIAFFHHLICTKS